MNILKTFFISLIKFYKLVISPFLGVNCRYVPTCSDYAIQSIEQKGIIRGLYSSFKSIYLQDRENKIKNSDDGQDDWGNLDN